MSDLVLLAKKARAAMSLLANSSVEKRNQALTAMAQALIDDTDDILAANELDLANAAYNGMTAAMTDRLRLTSDRIKGISDAIGELIELDDPLVRDGYYVRRDGLTIIKNRVPFGLVAIIFEARPNVTADAASLALKSGNAVILRGGKEAIHSNLAIVKSLKKAVSSTGLDGECIQIVSDTSRESAKELMTMNGMIDLLIPRGGKSLIRSVVENATVPVIETGAGNCHTYVDADADIPMALDIVDNAKRQRPSVCNACETVLVHRDIAGEFVPLMEERLCDVELRCCDEALALTKRGVPASESDWDTEYNDLVLAVRVVGSVDEAIDHINTHGTKHSEAIVTSTHENGVRFCSLVDAAAVYVNASTRFTDGNEFGLGAEIGISTQKLHARGPMGLDALTTVKYTVHGTGHTRK